MPKLNIDDKNFFINDGLPGRIRAYMPCDGNCGYDPYVYIELANSNSAVCFTLQPKVAPYDCEEIAEYVVEDLREWVSLNKVALLCIWHELNDI